MFVVSHLLMSPDSRRELQTIHQFHKQFSQSRRRSIPRILKTLLRHYDKQLPKHVDIILGHRHKDYKGCALSMTVKSSRAFVWSSIPTYIFLVSAEADTWYGWWQPGLGAGQRRRGRGGGDRGLGLMRLRPAVIITAKLSQAPLLETNTQITCLILACAAMCCLHDRKTYPV